MRIDPETWRQVLARDDWTCQYCGVDLLATFSSYWSATADHVHAASAGGSDDSANLVACCSACNSMLCRSGHLLAVAERKQFVAGRREQEKGGYENWLKEHRGR